MNKKVILKPALTLIMTISFAILLYAANTTTGHKHLDTPSCVSQEASHPIDVSSTALQEASPKPKSMESYQDFTYAAKVAMPAVVHIKSIREAKTIKNRAPRNSLEQFFKDFFGNEFQFMPYNKPSMESSGSGVIYTSDGYIITNNHVVQDGDSIEVTLYDKRAYPAKLVGSDQNFDLAVLKIEEKDLPYLTLGNSNNIEVGQWVLAIGNPLGLTSTVTQGIVSAKFRDLNLSGISDNLYDKEAHQSFIQVDAAINCGNSGGALVNLKGELIGINTYLASLGGNSFIGYGFAIPSCLVKKVSDDLIKYGIVQRVILGLSTRDVDAKLAKKYQLKQVRGVYIHHIKPDSPCVNLLKEEDIIIGINNKPVQKASEFHEFISCCKPGDKLLFNVWRKGKESAVTLELKKEGGFVPFVQKNGSILVEGAVFQNIDPAIKAKFNLTAGVYVKDIQAGKFRNAGLKRGDILVSMDKKAIKDTEALVDILYKVKGPVLLGVLSPNGKGLHYLAIDFGENTN